MSFWHRAPREVYRVYGEDEYLAGDGSSAGGSVPADEDLPVEDEALGDAATAESYSSLSSRRDATFSSSLDSSRTRTRRLLGLGVLAVVTGGTLGLVVLNASHRPGATAGTSARGGQLDGVSSGSRVARAPVVEVRPTVANGLDVTPLVMRSPRRRSSVTISRDL